MFDMSLRELKREVVGISSTIALTCATVAMVYARNHRFFYRDDVEHQHMGVFTALHHNGYGINALGSFHRSWFLSLITGEVQFGVFNPFSRVRDFIAASGDNLAVAATLIALLFMVIAALGAYTAARALQASPAMATAAAMFVTFNVHLLYWDASSWTPALIGFSWFAWFVASIWWTRRNIRCAPFIPIAGYLLVSAGWPHAMIAGGVVALVVGLEQLFTRQWKTREALIYAAACISVALLSSPVWISAQVFADWAARAPHGLFNDGFLTHQLDSLVLTFSPFVQPYVDGFAGQGFMFEPITYIAWITPLAAYWVVTSARIRKLVRVDIVVAGIVSVGMLGPSILGPTRWPFRFQPFAAFLVVMVAIRVLQSASTEKSEASRFIGAWKWIAPVAWLALTALRPRLIPMLLTALLLVGIAVAHRIYVSKGLRIFAPLLSASVILTTAWLMYASPSPAMPGDRNAPSSRSAIAEQYKVLEGHRVFVLQGDLAGAMTIEKKRGRFRLIPNLPTDITAAEMADGNIILAANLDTEFVTGYSAMPHEGLENLFKTRVFGWSTSETAAALFARDSTTRLPNYTLMGIDAIMVEKGEQETWFNAANDGTWEASYRQPAWTLFTRSAPSPRTVTWHDTTLQVSQLKNEAAITANTFGGSFVLARPVTPGMKISVGGTQVPFTSLSGAVPIAKVPANVTGNIAVEYSLPHQTLVLFLVLSGVGVLLGLAFTVLRRSRPH